MKTPTFRLYNHLIRLSRKGKAIKVPIELPTLERKNTTRAWVNLFLKNPRIVRISEGRFSKSETLGLRINLSKRPVTIPFSVVQLSEDEFADVATKKALDLSKTGKAPIFQIDWKDKTQSKINSLFGWQENLELEGGDKRHKSL